MLVRLLYLIIGALIITPISARVNDYLAVDIDMKSSASLVSSVREVLPDFVIENASVTNDAVEFDFANRGGSTALAQAYPFMVLAEWLDSKNRVISSKNVTVENHDIPAGSSLNFNSAEYETANRWYPDSDSFVINPPKNAAKLRITANPPDAPADYVNDEFTHYIEKTRANNSVVVARQKPIIGKYKNQKTDIVVQKVNLLIWDPKDNQKKPTLSYELFNKGTAAIKAGDLWLMHEWLDKDDKAIGYGLVTKYPDTISANTKKQYVINGIAPYVNADGLYGYGYLESSDYREEAVGEYITMPPAGAVKLRVTADPYNYLTEKMVSNNSARVNRPLPDLKFENFYANLSDKIWWTIVNAGNGPTDFHDVNSFYRNNTTQIIPLAVAHEWLDANGDSLKSFNVSIWLTGWGDNTGFTSAQPYYQYTPEGTFMNNPPPTGARYLRVVIDKDNKQKESNELNNTMEYVVNRKDNGNGNIYYSLSLSTSTMMGKLLDFALEQKKDNDSQIKLRKFTANTGANSIVMANPDLTVNGVSFENPLAPKVTISNIGPGSAIFDKTKAKIKYVWEDANGVSLASGYVNAPNLIAGNKDFSTSITSVPNGAANLVIYLDPKKILVEDNKNNNEYRVKIPASVTASIPAITPEISNPIVTDDSVLPNDIDDDISDDSSMTTPVVSAPAPTAIVAPVNTAIIKTPSFTINLTKNGNDYVVTGKIDYYGKGGGCEGPRPFDPVIVSWGDGANEPTVKADGTFSASHRYTIKNDSYTLTVAVYNSCYSNKTEKRTVVFTL